MASEGGPEAGEQGDYDKLRPSKFRFKSKRKREDEANAERRSNKRHKERSSQKFPKISHHEKRKRSYHAALNDDPSLYDDTYQNTYDNKPQLDPDIAFRESLFDALADDEGAAYWEGVYGQPIHTYPNAKSGPNGELEQMTDAEYAEYVRKKMWEKSHENVMEERRKREERLKREKEERRKNNWQQEDDRDLFEEKVAASLRRGQARKSQKRWEVVWKRYLDGWDEFAKTVAAGNIEQGLLAEKGSRGIIPWPVETGRWKDTDKEDIEHFFCSAPPTESDLNAILKIERVRWHPDKMQQRFGQNKLDQETVRAVTTVFQVVDRLWTENKGRT